MNYEPAPKTHVVMLTDSECDALKSELAQAKPTDKAWDVTKAKQMVCVVPSELDPLSRHLAPSRESHPRPKRPGRRRCEYGRQPADWRF
jgi:hypothetical protein